jgi:1-acyl-sn-glycerol-3-phosphate acyltransferase
MHVRSVDKSGVLVTRSGRGQLPRAYRLAVVLVRPLMTALTHRVWRGAEHLPTSGGFVVAANHTSHVDPLVLAHFLYDSGHPPYYLTKEALFRVPGVGAMVRGAGQIPVYRNTTHAAEAFSAAVAAVEEGKCVVVYPEATITRDPGLWPMTGKTGAARVALTTGCPLIPVAQWGAHELLGPYEKLPRLFPRTSVHVVAGPPVGLDDLRGRPLDGAVLAEASGRLLDAVTRLLEGLRGERAPQVRFDARAHGLPPTGDFRRRGRERA